MSSNNDEHPGVRCRESLVVLCDDINDNVPLQGPTPEYPYFMAFRSKTPIAIIGNLAALTDDFYKHVKKFPVSTDLQQDLLSVFKNYIPLEK